MPHRHTVIGALGRVGQVGTGNTRPAGAFLVVFRYQLAHLLAPVGARIQGIGTGLQYGKCLGRNIAQHLRVRFGRTTEAGLDFPVVKGAHTILAYPYHGLRAVLLRPWIDVRHDGIDIIQRPGVDDQLAVGRIGVLRIDRQVETRWPGTDKGADPGHAILLQQFRLQATQFFRYLFYARALRQPVVDHELGA